MPTPRRIRIQARVRALDAAVARPVPMINVLRIRKARSRHVKGQRVERALVRAVNAIELREDRVTVALGVELRAVAAAVVNLYVSAHFLLSFFFQAGRRLVIDGRGFFFISPPLICWRWQNVLGRMFLFSKLCFLLKRGFLSQPPSKQERSS